MKNITRISIFIGLLACIAGTSQAQYYIHSAGIRLGGSYGFTYKKFFDQNQAFEFLFGGRNTGIQLTGTYQYYKPLNLSKNETFFIFYGGGGHIGYEKYPVKTLNPGPPADPFVRSFHYEEKSFFSMGIDGIFGVEYRFLTAPLTLGLDIKPFFSFIGFRYTRTEFWDTSLSVKYVF